MEKNTINSISLKLNQKLEVVVISPNSMTRTHFVAMQPRSTTLGSCLVRSQLVRFFSQSY